MSKTEKLAQHLEKLQINNMYKNDFYWTWDKTDDELDAIFTVADALRDLRDKGVPNIIITLGAQGCVLDCQASRLQLPCVPGVDAVDPTAAGDSFIGAFCVGVAAGLTQKDALTLATHTAAITVSRMGAQPSLPSLEEVLADMTRRECSPELIATIQTMLGD